MFDSDALSLLSCPVCDAPSLSHETFEGADEHGILEALVWCGSCGAWFPIEDGVLDLLIGELAYIDDRTRFEDRHPTEVRSLSPTETARQAVATSSEAQSRQQAHFDWYSANDQQSYLEYERQPFWQAADTIAFADWRPRIRPGRWLLDVGCGNGRSTFKLADLDINVLAFDVAKRAVRQAEQRAREAEHTARLSFFAADATRIPVRPEVMDYVLLYGVLHHMPDPRATCRAVERVLKPGGVYFGHENNKTVLRGIFELLQKIRPIWHEEAGPEEVISSEVLRAAFAGTGVMVRTRSSVFVPPHLINLLPQSIGLPFLKASDRICGYVPGLNRNGGVLLIQGDKQL